MTVKSIADRLQNQTDSTRILDRMAPLPPLARRSQVDQFMIGIMIGLAVAILALQLLSYPPIAEFLRRWGPMHYARLFPGDWTSTRVVAVVLALLAVFPAAIGVHEVGHVLGGLLAGFRFIELRVGPLHVNRPFRISFHRRSGTGYAGWASMLPARRDKFRLRAIVYVLAGPVTNLVSAGAVLLLPFTKGFFSELFIVVSLVLGVRELRPFAHPFSVSDGKLVWSLLRSREWSQRWLALMQLVAEMRNGVLPEALSADDLAAAIAYRDNSPGTANAHLIAYTAAFYQHKDAEAAQLLETCLKYSSHAPPAMREVLMSEAAVFQARRRMRADLAEAWLADMPERMHTPWMRTRAQAAILEAQGDFEGALRRLDEFEMAVLTVPDPARRDLALRLLRRWQSELRDR